MACFFSPNWHEFVNVFLSNPYFPGYAPNRDFASSTICSPDRSRIIESQMKNLYSPLWNFSQSTSSITASSLEAPSDSSRDT